MGAPAFLFKKIFQGIHFPRVDIGHFGVNLLNHSTGDCEWGKSLWLKKMII